MNHRHQSPGSTGAALATGALPRPPRAPLAGAAAVLVGLGAAGCDNRGVGVQILGVAAPNIGMGGACSFEANSEVFRSSTHLNTQPPNQLSLTLRARYENQMSATEVVVSRTTGEELQPAARVSPLRFDLRWECESNGFGGVDRFFMPTFQPTQSFCVNERDAAGSEVGFDTVTASGPAVEQQGVGLASFTPVPAQLGAGFDAAYALAQDAFDCCEAVGGDCTAATETTPTPNGVSRTACEDADASFTPLGYAFGPEALERWRQFALYNGFGQPTSGSEGFPMRIVGQMELVTASGRTVVSNDLSHVISTCRGCARPTDLCTEPFP